MADPTPIPPVVSQPALDRATPVAQTPPPSSNKPPVRIFVLLFLLACVLGLFYYTTIQNPQLLPTLLHTQQPLLPQTETRTRPVQQKQVGASVSATVAPTATPTPMPILQGKETYTISQSSKIGPKITSLVVDPHDPKVNQNQTLSVAASDPQGVTGVTVEFISDTKTKTLTLTRTSGSNLEGVWSTTHTVADTVLYRYVVKILATGGSGQSTVTVTIR